MCAFNSMRTIEQSLRSAIDCADRVLVVDSGSTDGTVELAQSLGCAVMHRDWPGSVDQKQFALDQCADFAWVLTLDSDEIIEPQLQESIRRAVDDDDPRYDGWAINRRVRMFGNDLRYTFQPEWRLRLTRGGTGRLVGLGGHDRIEVPGSVGRLTGDCVHDSWRDIDHMMHAYIKFAKLAAAEYPKGGRALDILLRPAIAFGKQYIGKQGFRDGKAGFFACGAVAAGNLIKHLYIAHRRWKLDQSADRDCSSPAPGSRRETPGG